MSATTAQKYAYQARHRALGLCEKCPRKKTLYASRCNRCQLLHRKRVQKARHLKAWREGSPGTPPRGERLLSERT